MSEEQAVSDSGGTMRRLVGPPGDAVADLAILAPLRRVEPDEPTRPAGGPPYLEEGAVVEWRYGGSVDLMRVVRDDHRGLVAWLSPGSERTVAAARDGRGLRERSVEERAALAVAGDWDRVVATWRGSGVLRAAPTGVPWSVWWFWDDDGGFDGHYVNLELPHERPVDGAPRTHSRDLTLDLWVDATGTWLKDEDELDAGAAAGWCTPEQAAQIRAAAEQARRELVEPRAWPLDEGWEGWRPPADLDEPLRF